MILLLCPECLQWREPKEASCPVCDGRLDQYLPDLLREDLANGIGDWRESLGEWDVNRTVLPTRGELHLTTTGLLFVPHRSVVFSFDEEPLKPVSRISRLLSALAMPVRKLHSWLIRDVRSSSASQSRPLQMGGRDRFALAELLMSDPGVLFVARASIVSWRRQRRRWEFLLTNARWLPERFTPRGRDGGQRLQQWLENTACPLQHHKTP